MRIASLSEIGFERLKMIHPEFEEKEWYYEKLLWQKDIVDRDKLEYKEELDEEITFNPNTIQGVYHSDYKNRTWIEYLGALKRFDDHRINSREAAMSMIMNRKQSIHINVFGDVPCVGDGHHRCCLARFLEVEMPNMPIAYHL